MKPSFVLVESVSLPQVSGSRITFVCTACRTWIVSTISWCITKLAARVSHHSTRPFSNPIAGTTAPIQVFSFHLHSHTMSDKTNSHSAALTYFIVISVMVSVFAIACWYVCYCKPRRRSRKINRVARDPERGLKRFTTPINHVSGPMIAHRAQHPKIRVPPKAKTSKRHAEVWRMSHDPHRRSMARKIARRKQSLHDGRTSYRAGREYHLDVDWNALHQMPRHYGK